MRKNLSLNIGLAWASHTKYCTRILVTVPINLSLDAILPNLPNVPEQPTSTKW